MVHFSVEFIPSSLTLTVRYDYSSFFIYTCVFVFGGFGFFFGNLGKERAEGGGGGGGRRRRGGGGILDVRRGMYIYILGYIYIYVGVGVEGVEWMEGKVR